MYFIAFFLGPKTHCVVPYKWVRGIVYEDIVNNGINRNKKFRVFYTNDGNAFDDHGVPKGSYEPNQAEAMKIFQKKAGTCVKYENSKV